jgi:hypothetical protein
MDIALNVLMSEAKSRSKRQSDIGTSAHGSKKLMMTTDDQINDVLRELHEEPAAADEEEAEHELSIDYKKLWEKESERAEKFKRKIKTK